MVNSVHDRDTAARFTALILIGLLIVRLICILLTPLELYADEAQYWRWGQSLEWGYYSKPPLIAWLIHATTSVFGDSAWAIRLPAPFLHTIAAWCLFLLGRNMAGPKVGLMAAIGYALMPAVFLSSTVLSTDGVLMPIWALALWLTWRVRQGEAGWIGFVSLGLAIGAGFLAKYAMLYFVIGLALIIVFDGPSRRHFLSLKGVAAALTALAVFAPHLVWNAQNDFATVGHTVDNANLGGDLFNPEHAFKFLADQMGVFGPISFLGLVAGLTFMNRTVSGEAARKELWLACFIVPVLAIILGQSILSRAHANWAATAYPAASVFIALVFLRAKPNRPLWFWIAGLTAFGCLLIPDFTIMARLGLGLTFAAAITAAAFLARFKPEGLFWTGLGIHTLIGSATMAIMIFANTMVGPLGLDNAFKRTRGWDAISDQLVGFVDENGTPSALVVDEREIWHGLDFYLKDRIEAPLLLWRYNEGAHSFAEQRPLTDALDDNVLIASYRPNRRPAIAADFETFARVGEVSVDLGERSNGCPIVRRLVLYRASGFDPLPRTQDWVERFDNQTMGAPEPCPAAD
ncbi:glycosyltransferase family 39 protein [Henriciella mobilis]|uniref:ArnT family glycosyltransferase n=1 Tax=Henriciella mobilis TaxID=2305467 RepID=UPI000E670146|nr:glycosyltransferase family 39 protein [Henriciella mobilis]RIJ17554.1 glycosyltransferase family 39 protein [Henriciella mobilis]RIJ25458.1 glycosyltransferase family 39 protein [Henriciella mobilis]